MNRAETLRYVDSHTAGEPTRVVLSGLPNLGEGSLATRRDVLRDRFDHYRRAILCEPRGGDVWVGALLTPAHTPGCATGVVFCNNVGYLGMCGHATIGLAATLRYLGMLAPGQHVLETPVGQIPITLAEDGAVTLRNVPAYRYLAGVPLHVPGYGLLHGDVAWGGNWFFLVREEEPVLTLNRVEELTQKTWAIRQALAAEGITGEHGAEIDHVELFGPPSHPEARSRNFVLCPGKAYDRSPCGTGTSAKLACLVADGKLQPGEPWVQEGMSGQCFTAWAEVHGDRIHPILQGRAYVQAQGELLLHQDDPFCWGLG